jgi:hypothetical protein
LKLIPSTKESARASFAEMIKEAAESSWRGARNLITGRSDVKLRGRETIGTIAFIADQYAGLNIAFLPATRRSRSTAVSAAAAWV